MVKGPYHITGDRCIHAFKPFGRRNWTEMLYFGLAAAEPLLSAFNEFDGKIDGRVAVTDVRLINRTLA